MEGKNASDPAPVMGLILAGGYSSRMGTDKAGIVYHGIPQYLYLYQLLRTVIGEVFISCRADQMYEGVPRIVDQYTDIGPLAGVLSSFHHKADTAWLTVPCDMPLLDMATITYLIDHRDPSGHATFFVDPVTGFPEPLLTIFEPSIFPVLMKAYLSGQLSLNRILRECDGNGIAPLNPEVLKSINAKS